MSTPFRYMANNFIGDTAYHADHSSEGTQGEARNLAKSERWKVWQPTGYFLIDTTNRTLFINDGSNKTVNIATGEYTTPASLALAIAAALNASSSGWSVNYNASYKFDIARTTSGTVRYTQTSNSIWSTIGHTGSLDVTGTSFPGDVVRIHTHEFIIWDMTSSITPTFFALIGGVGEDISLSSSAVVKIQGNGSNVWTSPSFTQTLTRTDNGYFYYLPASTTYRYWRLYIEDKTNSLGPTGISLSQCYLGTYDTLVTRNITSGFVKTIKDNSLIVSSYKGAKFVTTQTKVKTFDGLAIPFIDSSDRATLETMIYSTGIGVPFYIDLDPVLDVSTSGELIGYYYFSDYPKFTHIKTDIYTVNFSIEEAV